MTGASHISRSPVPEPASFSSGNRPFTAISDVIPIVLRMLAALPTPKTSLIGRERHAAKDAGLLWNPDVRMLTLTGLGAVGISRLALRVACVLAAQ
ncbi:MAG: hypothetical protein AVDCRST_MAG19-1555 [uncultured Thermomicrobiales bacterium]|uniref:Uncharacterized protein n=1 Tax=uncultured Thermomicrobiales bacterium TaxID=1645740 RepID=A0A6J4U6A7_9BACT|nr:MAG: hypothetical protein AVDCRST_MAG19-1555 [uncultured Thermomicrobiales bacterium]